MTEKKRFVLSFQHLASRMAPEGSKVGCRPCDPITGRPLTDDESYAMNRAIFAANGNTHVPTDADPNPEVQAILRGSDEAMGDLDMQEGLKRARSVKHQE